MSNISYKYLKVLSEREKKELFKNKNSLWQSLIWGEILTRTKQAEVIICTTETDTILIERRKIFRDFTGLYILGVSESALSDELIAYIQENIKTSQDLFLQIEPLSCETSPLTPLLRGEGNEMHSNSKAPFRRFIEPVTAILHLKSPCQGGEEKQEGTQGVLSEEELMNSFAEKGRYNIRLSVKRGVTTRWVKANEKQINIEKTYLQAFYDLLEETTERDGFSHNSLEYYRYFIETLEANNAGGLLIAEKDGVLHAAGIFAYYGDTAIYYYGASSSNKEIRRDMATYKLQSDAIGEAINRGCKYYDFLGISEDGKGKLAGVTEFKLRFNPEKVHLPHEQVIVFKPFVLKVLQMISKIRKILR